MEPSSSVWREKVVSDDMSGRNSPKKLCWRTVDQFQTKRARQSEEAYRKILLVSVLVDEASDGERVRRLGGLRRRDAVERLKARGGSGARA